LKKKRHTNIPASYLIPKKWNYILMLRRFNTWFQDGQYSFIAGHVDPWESFTQCVVREAKEEANIKILNEDLTVAHVMQRNSWWNHERIDIFYTTEKWKWKILNMESEKCDNLSWFEINNLPENTIPYIQQAVHNIRREILYSEFWWKSKGSTN
jgi:8-oxo-dGTP diphosphatase